MLVTTHALSSAAYCNPKAWTTVGSDLIVDIVCFNGGGAGVNGGFIIVVIE